MLPGVLSNHVIVMVCPEKVIKPISASRDLIGAIHSLRRYGNLGDSMASCGAEPFGTHDFQISSNDASRKLHSDAILQRFGSYCWRRFKCSCKMIQHQELRGNLEEYFGLKPSTQCKPDTKLSISGRSPWVAVEHITSFCCALTFLLRNMVISVSAEPVVKYCQSPCSKIKVIILVDGSQLIACCKVLILWICSSRSYRGIHSDILGSTIAQN